MNEINLTIDPTTIKNDTIFNEVTHRIIKDIENSEGTARLLLSAKLEEIKCHYYHFMAESCGHKWRHIGDTYLKDAHSAFNRLMSIFKQLPEEE